MKNIVIFQVAVLPSTVGLRQGTRDCQVNYADWKVHILDRLKLSHFLRLTPAMWGLGHNKST